MKLIQKMTDGGLTASFSEAKRKIMCGNVKVNGDKVVAIDTEVKPGDLIEMGQRQIEIPAEANPQDN